MDIQTGLFCLGIAFLSAIVIFFISMFGMKEKTYEEAIAEQRKLSEEHLLLGRTVKDKNKDKKQKKAGKKVKEKPMEREKVDQVGSTSSLPKIQEKNVFEEHAAKDLHSQEDKKSKKKEKVKQIVVGKQQQHEKPVAREISVTNPFEENRSKDVLVLKQKDNKEKLNAKVSAARLKETGVHEPIKVVTSNKGISPKSEKQATAHKAEKATASKAEKATAPKLDKLMASKVEKATISKVEKVVAPKVEKIVASKVEKENVSKLEKVAIPKVEKIAAPKVEKQANPKLEKASNLKIEKVTPPKAEKITASKAEKVTAPKAEKVTASKAEKITAPKAEKVTAPKAEKVTAPKAEKLPASKAEKLPASKLEKAIAPKVEKIVPPKLEKVVAAKVDKVAKLEKLLSASNVEMPVVTLITKEKSKKKKSELATLQQMSVNRDGVNVSLLVPLVHKAELSRSEIQILIDLLLNKQQGSSVENSEWIEGRQDPVVKLRKQLTDKERALTEEQEASQAMQSKLKELRTQLNTERSRHTLASRTMEEALSARQQELSVLSTKLQQSVDSHCTEKQALTLQLQQVQAKLNEDHLTLQQELVSQRQQIEFHLEAEAGYKVQVGQLHAQLKEQSSDNGHLHEQVSRLEAQVRHLDEASGQAQDLARQLEEVQHLAQQHDAELQYQLATLREQLDAAGAHLTAKVAALFSVEVEARQLREENESLAAQVTAVTERPAAEGRENGETYPEPLNKLDHGIVKQQEAQLEQQSLDLKQKDCLIEDLNLDINTYKTEISKVNQELEAQRSRNNDLQSKNWKVMDALSATEKSLESNLKESPKLVSEAAQEARVSEQTATKQLLQRIFPDIIHDEKVYSTWLEGFEGSVCTLLAELRTRPQQEECDSALEELEDQNRMLKARVTHYKIIINDTEGILNRLQGHVEEEEMRWRQQLLLKDTQLEALTEEKARLELALGQGNMNDQLKELEDKLEVAEAEKQDLELKYKELLCSSCQVENISEEHSALRKEVARLKSLVQIEQQSLGQEQPSSQLQQQLNNVDQNHSVATNGPVAEPSLTESGCARK